MAAPGNPENPTSAKGIARTERREKVMALKRQGASEAEIAAQVGASRQTVVRDVREGLRLRYQLIADQTQHYVALQESRYQELLTVVYGQALDGDLAALDRVLVILAQLNRLYGIERPPQGLSEAHLQRIQDQIIDAVKDEPSARMKIIRAIAPHLVIDTQALPAPAEDTPEDTTRDN